MLIMLTLSVFYFLHEAQSSFEAPPSRHRNYAESENHSPNKLRIRKPLGAPWSTFTSRQQMSCQKGRTNRVPEGEKKSQRCCCTRLPNKQKASGAKTAEEYPRSSLGKKLRSRKRGHGSLHQPYLPPVHYVKKEAVISQERGQHSNVHLQPWDARQAVWLKVLQLEAVDLHWQKLHRRDQILYRHRGILPSNQSWMLCELRRREHD